MNKIWRDARVQLRGNGRMATCMEPHSLMVLGEVLSYAVMISPPYNPMRWLSFLFSFLQERNRPSLLSSLAYVPTLVSSRGWTCFQVCLTPKAFCFLKNTLCRRSQLKIFQGQGRQQKWEKMARVGGRRGRKHIGKPERVWDASFKGGSTHLVPRRQSLVGWDLVLSVRQTS